LRATAQNFLPLRGALLHSEPAEAKIAYPPLTSTPVWVPVGVGGACSHTFIRWRKNVCEWLEGRVMMSTDRRSKLSPAQVDEDGDQLRQIQGLSL